jgi:outer membrane protein OmpA-like peptidoglycan-associated protein
VADGRDSKQQARGTPGNDAAALSGVTDGGIVAKYPPRGPRVFHVAPTHDGSITNTVVLDPWPTPTACVRLDHARFGFDSSFPRATLSTELDRLFALRPPGDPKGHKLAVFGHADPTGDEAYNKTLSGRRAKAIYALLTRQPELWDELHQGAFRGDRWGVESLYACLERLGYEPGPAQAKVTPKFHAAVRAFQKERGLEPNGRTEKPTRVALFGAYMDALTAGHGGTPRAYTPKDFVGEGLDRGHRGAYQGCGERNPAMVLSDAEAKELDKPNRRDERNRVQAVNRRVLIFLYEPDDVRFMDVWECPAATEGPSACNKVAWSDKDYRLAPRDTRREIRRGGKTFGCQFYDFTARLSPCEALKGTLRVWLLDEEHQRMPGARYRLKVLNSVREGTADTARGREGFVLESELPLGVDTTIEWGDGARFEDNHEASPLDRLLDAGFDTGSIDFAHGIRPRGGTLSYRGEIKTNAEVIARRDGDVGDALRLLNLGFLLPGGTVDDAEQRYRRRYGRRNLADVHRKGLPAARERRYEEPSDPAAFAPRDAPSAERPPQNALSEEEAPPLEASEEDAATRAPAPCECPPELKQRIHDELRRDAELLTAGDAFVRQNVASFTVSPVVEAAYKAPDEKDAPPQPTATAQLYRVTFLGRRMQQRESDTQIGLCRNFALRLAAVEQRLFEKYKNAPDRKGCDTRDFYEWCAITQDHSGFRRGAFDLHSSGSAIDLNMGGNPHMPMRGKKLAGETHSEHLKAIVTSGGKLNALGTRAAATYGIAPTADVDTVVKALAKALTVAHIWNPFLAAVDRAHQVIVKDGEQADLSYDGERAGRVAFYRDVYKRLTAESLAVRCWFELAFGPYGGAKTDLSRARLSLTDACAAAARLRLLGLAQDESVLGAIFPNTAPDPARERYATDATVRRRIDGDARALAARMSTTECDLVRALHDEAFDAHAVMRRGVVSGNISWWSDEDSARSAAIAGLGLRRGAAPSPEQLAHLTVFPVPELPDVHGMVPNWRDPRAGFIRLRWEIVQAFIEDPQCRWGATDFGTQSGDIMHFDFTVPDPGKPASDPNLDDWREWQKEKKATYEAFERVRALNEGAPKDPLLVKHHRRVADAKASTASVAAADEHARNADAVALAEESVTERTVPWAEGTAWTVANFRRVTRLYLSQSDVPRTLVALVGRCSSKSAQLRALVWSSGDNARRHRESLELVESIAANLRNCGDQLARHAKYMKDVVAPAVHNARVATDESVASRARTAAIEKTQLGERLLDQLRADLAEQEKRIA